MPNLFASVGTFDPLNVDLTYIKSVCSKIPKDGHIDLNVADELATTFLQCADDITDMICQCAAYCGKAEAGKHSAKADAIDARINDTSTKVAATVAVQLYTNDPKFLEAKQKHDVAEAFLEWLRTKYKNLMAAHVLCKDIMKMHFDSQTKGSRRASSHPHDLEEETEESAAGASRAKPGPESW